MLSNEQHYYSPLYIEAIEVYKNTTATEIQYKALKMIKLCMTFKKTKLYTVKPSSHQGKMHHQKENTM